ncbi:MAG: HD superfamily phosphohydrolase [Cyclobacteriaceae bacterium]
MQINKNKILNDPVFGFITIPNDLIFDIIEHPYFQRLRRIKQLGLSNLVYPGALHTRFHHALGAMHLMQLTLKNLSSKGVDISDEEFNASLIAILLHDIGHGPFSHTLEFSLLNGISHEEISLAFLHKLNADYQGKLDLAIKIFQGSYERRFFHQLVSSQLDIDRIDYLRRDSFFTGVSEGTIGSERIIKMLDVRDDQIVVEEKGIYSIENFLNARRLMYWQVYLHKTSVSAEEMLIQLVKRARYLTQQGVSVLATPALSIFLERDISKDDFKEDADILDVFALLDDSDIWGSMKFWLNHDDFVLSTLSKMILGRKIFKIEMSNAAFSKGQIEEIHKKTLNHYKLSEIEVRSFVGSGKISNEAYISSGQKINILTKKGELIDIAKATELPNITAMSKIVSKYYLCWPKEVAI